MVDSSPTRLASRLGAALVVLGAAAVVFASAASAHVGITPNSAAAGGYTTIAFKVPNEKADASTTKVEVQLPTDHPIANVSIQPVPGWTATMQKAPLAKPIKTDDGEITEAVSTITWSGGSIEPGQFQTFPVSVGPLPTDATTLVFKALQTYSDGDVVRWIDEPAADGAEVEHPAPTLTLTAPTGSDHGTTGHDAAATSSTTVVSGTTGGPTVSATPEADNDDDDSAQSLATVAVALSALALVVSLGAMLAMFRRPKGDAGS